jgi:hypothetical protein
MLFEFRHYLFLGNLAIPFSPHETQTNFLERGNHHVSGHWQCRHAFSALPIFDTHHRDGTTGDLVAGIGDHLSCNAGESGILDQRG